MIEPHTGNRGDSSSKGRAAYLVVAVAAVFVAARLWNLTSYGLFGDEVFTLWTADQPWSGVFSSVVGDVVHPPLFYSLLKVWIDTGGQSLLWLKLLPAVLSIGALLPFLLLCLELRMKPLSMALAMWLMAINGFLISHAQELRMYSLLLLLATSSLWLFARLQACESGINRIRIALGVVNLLLVFTHYFGWVVIALELVFLIVWRRRMVRSFAIATIFIAVCFSPWVYFVAHAARTNPSRVTFVWNRPPAFSELVGYYANLNGSLSYRWKVFGTAIVMLVFLWPIVAWCARVLRARGARAGARRFEFLMIFAFGPAAAAFFASHLLPQPVWAFRYLIIAAPAYFLTIAVALERLPRARVGNILVVLIAVWAGFSGFSEMMSRDRVAWEPLVSRMIKTERDQTGAGAANIARRSLAGARSPVAVYVTDPNVGNTIQYYLDRAGETGFQITTVDDLKAPAGEHSWVAFIRYKHESGAALRDVLAERGYDVGDIIEAHAAGHDAVLLEVWKRG